MIKARTPIGAPYITIIHTSMNTNIINKKYFLLKRLWDHFLLALTLFSDSVYFMNNCVSKF